MQLTITNNEVTIVGSNIVGFEQSNMVAAITGTVDTEAGWNFTLLIQRMEDNSVDQIFFTRQDSVIYSVLTADMLPVSGRYIGQFQISQGMMVGLTNQFEFWVENTVNLEDAFTPIPTAFLQLATNVRILYEHPPTPGENGYWMIWNPMTGEYEQSDIAVTALPIASATTLGGVKIGEGVNVTDDGTISVRNTGGSGITQEEADQRYLQLSGGTMDGDIDMSDHNLNNVSFVKAAGTYNNAGIRFNSNGTIIDFVTGYSTALELSANSVNAMNHTLENVSDIDMSSGGTIDNAKYVGSETDITGRTCTEYGPDFVNFWVNGKSSMSVYESNINAGGYPIKNVGEPSTDSDVATKGYVDNAIATGGGGGTGGITQEQADARYLQLSGGTMSGSVNMGSNKITNLSDPQNYTDAANMQYVNNALFPVASSLNNIISGDQQLPYLSNSGGTLTGALNMGNNKITMGATPTETTDVTNKGYVDGVVKVVSDEVDGILAGTTPITLPIASDTHIGGVKVGTGLSITEDGTLNATQQQQELPMASELTLGAVKVGTGLHIENDGTLEATAGLYRDPAAGVAFVGPSESKTIMLQRAYQVLYIGYMYISSTVVDPIATTPIYLNAGQNMTDQSSSHLTVSFDENGASFSATNLDSTIGIFMFYGGFQEKNE